MSSAATLFDYPAQDAMIRAAEVMDIVAGRKPASEMQAAPGINEAVAGVAIALQDGHSDPETGRRRLAEEWLIPGGQAGLHMTRAIAREIEGHEVGQPDATPRTTMERITRQVMQGMGEDHVNDAVLGSISQSAAVLAEQRGTMGARCSYMHEKLSDFRYADEPLFRDTAPDAGGRHIRADLRLDQLAEGATPASAAEAGVAAHIKAMGYSGRRDVSTREARLSILAEHDHSRPTHGQSAPIDPASESAATIALRTEALAVAMRQARSAILGRGGMEEFRRNQAITDGRLSALKGEHQVEMFTRLHHAEGIPPLAAMNIGMTAQRVEAERTHQMGMTHPAMQQDRRAASMAAMQSTSQAM